MAYRSPLGRLMPDSLDVERVKREGWQQDQILVVDFNNDRLDPIERELFRQWGNQRYGSPARMK